MALSSRFRLLNLCFDELQGQDCYSSQWLDHLKDESSLVLGFHFAVKIRNEEKNEPMQHFESLHRPGFRVVDEWYELADNMRNPLFLIDQLVITV